MKPRPPAGRSRQRGAPLTARGTGEDWRRHWSDGGGPEKRQDPCHQCRLLGHQGKFNQHQRGGWSRAPGGQPAARAWSSRREHTSLGPLGFHRPGRPRCWKDTREPGPAHACGCLNGGRLLEHRQEGPEPQVPGRRQDGRRSTQRPPGFDRKVTLPALPGKQLSAVMWTPYTKASALKHSGQNWARTAFSQ